MHTSALLLAARALAQEPVRICLDRASGRLVKRSGPDVPPARPGSTVKPFVLAALLRQAGFDSAKRLPCSGRLRLGGRSFDCSHPRMPGGLNAEEALAFSCNQYFSYWSQLLQPDGLQRWLVGFGLRADRASGPDGLRRQVLGEDHVSATPFELAEAYRRLVIGETDPKLGPLFRGLRLAVEAGSARAAGPSFSGKTGTAAALGGRSLQGWFAGFSPRFVVVIWVPTGRGGVDAAPLAESALPTPKER